MKPETVEWVRKADGDYQVAQREMQTDHPVFDAVCFHAQQCVEKCLKAWLVEQAISFPRTHDLIVLLDLCASQLPELVTQRSSLAYLTTFAVAFRYPGEEAVREDAEESIQTMEMVYSLMRWRIGSPSAQNESDTNK